MRLESVTDDVIVIYSAVSVAYLVCVGQIFKSVNWAKLISHLTFDS